MQQIHSSLWLAGRSSWRQGGTVNKMDRQVGGWGSWLTGEDVGITGKSGYRGVATSRKSQPTGSETESGNSGHKYTMPSQGEPAALPTPTQFNNPSSDFEQTASNLSHIHAHQEHTAAQPSSQATPSSLFPTRRRQDRVSGTRACVGNSSVRGVRTAQPSLPGTLRVALVSVRTRSVLFSIAREVQGKREKVERTCQW